MKSRVGSEGRKYGLIPKRPDTSPRYGIFSPGPCAYQLRSKPKTSAFSMGRAKRN